MRIEACSFSQILGTPRNTVKRSPQVLLDRPEAFGEVDGHPSESAGRRKDLFRHVAQREYDTTESDADAGRLDHPGRLGQDIPVGDHGAGNPVVPDV
jgi:hypothetical protein